MIHVYHIKAANKISSVDKEAHRQAVIFGDTVSCKELFDAGNYTKVAELSTDDMNKAYQLTNNIEENWVNNKEVHVEPQFSKGCRSTSVGDIFVVNEIPHVVASIGFNKL